MVLIGTKDRKRGINMKNKKFMNERYATAGVNSELPFLYQMAIWQRLALFHKEGIEIDYFQVFEFEILIVDGLKVQKMRHRQECPEYEKEYVIPIVGDGFTGAVWVIDDGAYATMLFPGEY